MNEIINYYSVPGTKNKYITTPIATIMPPGTMKARPL